MSPQAFMEHAKDMDLRDLLDEAAFILKGYESEAGTKQSFSYEVSETKVDKKVLMKNNVSGETFLQETLLQPRALCVTQRSVET